MTTGKDGAMTPPEEGTETTPAESAQAPPAEIAETLGEELAETSSPEERKSTSREARARTAREELEAAIEAILFVATEPVATERLHALFGEDEREAVDTALAAVIARYPGGPAQGLVADFAAGGVRLVTRPALQGYLRKFFQVTGRTKLSMAALETLAIVAYRQPITAPEIQELRSVSSTGVLKTLLDHRLVRISGRKEVVGKPFLYSTSREFLVRFGLNRLQDLPPLEELEQMLQSQVEAEGGDGGAQGSLTLHADAFDSEAELDRAERAEEQRDFARAEKADRVATEEIRETEEGAAEESPPDAEARDLTADANEELAGAWLDEPTDDDLADPPEEDATGIGTAGGELSEDEVESTLAAIDWDDDDEPRSEDE